MSVPSRHSNPFASCWLQPAAAPLCVATTQQIEDFVQRLEQHHWRGAIVGPHGSGKSTLLEELVRRAQCVKRVVRVDFHDGHTHPLWQQLLTTRLTPDTLLVVDGFEQLNRYQRWRLVRRCRAQRAGLLVTSHRATLLPTLATLAPDVEVAQRIFQRLVSESPTPVQPSDVVRAFRQHKGNLRATLFNLYDLHEQRSRAPQQAN